MANFEILTENKRGKLVRFKKYPGETFYVRHGRLLSKVLELIIKDRECVTEGKNKVNGSQLEIFS